MNGIELATKLRSIHKDIALVFMSNKEDYAMASGVCSLTTAFCLAAFCVMAAIVA